MKNIKLEIGTVYKKTDNGNYFFRYQINGERKAVSLKTKLQKEAIKKAQELVPIAKARTEEIISAHVKYARGLGERWKTLELNCAWEVYSTHPDRATPATVSERESYRSTFNEFLKFVANDSLAIHEVDPGIADSFAGSMRGKDLAVDTHNRKIKRLRKIFEVLKEFGSGKNPFLAKSLQRKEREERGDIPRRLSFSKEQENELLKVLSDEQYRVMNKAEIRIVYHLGIFTGQRMKDCILLTWDNVDFKRSRISVKQFKTGKEVTIPIAPKLTEALHEALEWKENNYVCPKVAKRYNKVDAKGKNTGNNLVNIDVLRVIKWIGLEPSVKVDGRKKKVTVYGFHSLRHSFVSHCAEAGVPKAVVLSIIGANSNIVDKHYTHIGEEAQQKAIMAISGEFNGSSPQERINKALEIISRLKDDEKSDAVREIEKVLKGSPNC